MLAIGYPVPILQVDPHYVGGEAPTGPQATWVGNSLRVPYVLKIAAVHTLPSARVGVD